MQMATFNLNTSYTFAAGTAAADTFNLATTYLSVLGLDGDDVFVESGVAVLGLNNLDGGNGNDSFNLQTSSSENYVSGGAGNDSVFIVSGEQNNVLGGVGNDWLGIGGGASILTLNV